MGIVQVAPGRKPNKHEQNARTTVSSVRRRCQVSTGDVQHSDLPMFEHGGSGVPSCFRVYTSTVCLIVKRHSCPRRRVKQPLQWRNARVWCSQSSCVSCKTDVQNLLNSLVGATKPFIKALGSRQQVIWLVCRIWIHLRFGSCICDHVEVVGVRRMVFRWQAGCRRRRPGQRYRRRYWGPIRV